MAGGCLYRVSRGLVLLLLLHHCLKLSCQLYTQEFFAESTFVEQGLDKSFSIKETKSVRSRATKTATKQSVLSDIEKAKLCLSLTKYVFSTGLLIIISGDIHLNPGPVVDPCYFCSKGCRRNQRAIQCDSCDHWFHGKCIGMGKHEYELLGDESKTWMCQKCLFPDPNYFNASIDEPLAQMQESQDLDGNLFDDISLTFRRGLKMAHLNVNRLVNKMDDINALLQNHPFDVLSISESWLDRNVFDAEIKVEGYVIFRKDRTSTTKSNGGGLVTYVKESILCRERSDLSDIETEALWIEINRPKCRPLLLANIYRLIDINFDIFISSLDNALVNINMDRDDVVILGDFNVNMLPTARDKSLKQKLTAFANRNNLTQLITEPTRITETSKSAIDLIFVNNNQKIVQSGSVALPISDHNLIFCVMKVGVPKVPPKYVETRDYKQYDKETFLQDLLRVPWNVIDMLNNVDDALFLWGKMFSEVADKHAPIKSRRLKGQKTPWINPELLVYRKDRDYHFKMARRNNSAYNWGMYRKLRNFVNRLEKKLKSEYYCNLIEKVKGDGRKMWDVLKKTLPNNKTTEPTSISFNRKYLNKSKEIANALNTYFATIGKKLNKVVSTCFLGENGNNCTDTQFDQLYTNLTGNFNLEEIDEESVVNHLLSLKTNKAIGLDKMSTRLLKDSAVVIAPYLSKIINLSIRTAKFPSLWKSAKVRALFKGGDRSDPNNYRPISVLPMLSKLIEKHVHSQLYNYLIENNVLYRHQFGFRRKRSTTTALSKFVDDLLKNIDDSKVTGVIYLDLKKAFDTVDHQILVKKLKSIGITGYSLQWFQSYLVNRSQKTIHANTLSTTHKISTGVPQGSILGPLLFLIHINDMPSNIHHSSTTLFADDAAMSYSSNSPRDLEDKLNEDLTNVASWLNRNKLVLNVSKSKFMIVGNTKKLTSFSNVKIMISGEKLERKSSFRYLGVTINENLSWKDHIDTIQTKVNKQLAVLRRVKHLLTEKARKLVVCTMIVPILDYGNLVWGDRNNKTLMDSLQVLQHKAAKIILNRPLHSSATEALTILKWKPLNIRRKFLRCTYVHKCINNIIDHNLNFLYGTDVHCYNTRHKLDLRTNQSKSNSGLHTTQYFLVKEWNSIPMNIRDTVCINLFKRKLWKFLTF